MPSHSFIFAAVCLGGFTFACAAQAENKSGIETLKLEAEYDSCSTIKETNTTYCATEIWNIEVNSGGWTATSTGKDGAVVVMETEAACADGIYKSATNGQTWRGKCELIGDTARPCFHISGGNAKEAFSKVETTQCFVITDRSCQVGVEGVLIGQAESVKGEYLLRLKEQKSCRVVE